MPFMDPCLGMCLRVGLPAGGSGVVQLYLSKYTRSFSGNYVSGYSFILKDTPSFTFGFLTGLRVSIILLLIIL